MTFYDCHIHTSFSFDSDETICNILAAAAAKGLNGLCFTDHNDYNYYMPDGESAFDLDFEKYTKTLALLKKIKSSMENSSSNRTESIYKNSIKEHFFKNSPDCRTDIFIDNLKKLDILSGLEQGLDSRDEYAGKINACDPDRSFDFIIGSMHLVDDLDPYYPKYWEMYGIKGGIVKYFEYVLDSINSVCNYDVYGHLDYIIRYVPEKLSPSLADSLLPYDLIDEILKNLIYKGKGIEINTAGLSKGSCLDYNPNKKILSLYHDRGGEIITTGSDAHTADRVCDHIREATALLKEIGFNYTTIFRGRKAEFLKIQ